MMESTAEIIGFQVGSKVFAAGKRGIVRFIGETSFSPGTWVGMELETADGKNDGSVQGVRYFDVPANHGLFVRASQVEVEADVKDATTSVLAPAEESSENLAANRLAALRQKKAAALASRAALINRSQSANAPAEAPNEALPAGLTSPGIQPVERKDSLLRTPTPRTTLSRRSTQDAAESFGPNKDESSNHELTELRSELKAKVLEIEALNLELKAARSSQTSAPLDPSTGSQAASSEKEEFLKKQIESLEGKIEGLHNEVQAERQQRQAALDELRVFKEMKLSNAAEEKEKMADQARDKAALAAAHRKISELENQV